MTLEAKIDKTNELLEKVLATLAGQGMNPPPNTPAPTPAAAKPTATKPAKPKPTAAPDPAPVVEDTEVSFDDPEASEPEAKALTVDDARKALVALQKAKGSAEASRKVMSILKITSLSALKDEDQEKIAAIIAGCAKASQ